MPTIDEKIALARQDRDRAEKQFRKVLKEGRTRHKLSWSQLGAMSGLSRYGVRYLVENLGERRKTQAKGETTNGSSGAVERGN